MEFRALDGERWSEKTARAGFPILVEYAHASEPITYGDWDAEIVRRRLGKHTFVRAYRYPAEFIGDACEEYGQAAAIHVPPINLLVINQGTRLPGRGADRYIRRFCHEYLDRDIDLANLSERERRAIIDQVHNEIFDFRMWPDVLNAYGLIPARKIGRKMTAVGKRRRPNVGNWHTGPESQAHKDLKRLIAENSKLVGLEAGLKGREEKRLWSGDEIDVYFVEAAIGVEVKTGGAGFDEMHRGIFQCVKYRAVLQAQQMHERQVPKADCFLAVGGHLPKELQELAGLLRIKWFDRLAP
jgi:hypothetical protein